MDNDDLIYLNANKVEAIYTDQQVERLSGNPLIDALPEMKNFKEMYDGIKNYPQYNAKERFDNDILRLCYIQSLNELILPMAMHQRVYLNIELMFRIGYKHRNPIDKERKKILNNTSKVIVDDNNKDKYRSIIEYNRKHTFVISNGFSIVGISGIGKTTTVKRILSNFPQVIKHINFKGEIFKRTQVVWLYLSCPPNCSIKAFCGSFFKALDAAVNESNYDKYYKDSFSTVRMKLNMISATEKYCIGGIFIDEIQHLTESKIGSDTILDFLVDLDNVLSVPIVFIGTYKANSILQTDFRIARRASGIWEVLWDPMENDKQWEMFIKKMWKYQWTKKESELTPEIINAFFDCTQGITERVVKLYMLTQVRAILGDKECIDEKYIRHIAEKEMKLTKPMIDALRSKDKDALKIFDDINRDYVKEVIEDAKQKNISYIQLEEYVKELSDNKSKRTQYVIQELLLHGCKEESDIKILNDLALQVIDKYGVQSDINILKNKLIRAIAIYQDNKEQNLEEETNINNKVNDNKDLIKLYDKDENKNYSNLVQAGIIKNPVDDNKEIYNG